MIKEILNRLEEGKKFVTSYCFICDYHKGFILIEKRLCHCMRCHCKGNNLPATGIMEVSEDSIKSILRLNPNVNFLDDKYWR